MSSKVVTGSAGFIGSTLAQRLLDDGCDVVGIDCITDYYDPERKRQNLKLLRNYDNFTFVEADLRTDVSLVDAVVAECDVIYHQAGQPGVRSSWSDGFAEYVDRNVLATQRLLESVRGRTDLTFVYASSSSVYGNAASWPCTEQSVPRPFSPYGVTKLSAEHLVSLYAENFGLHSTSLRYFTVYGPRQRPDMAFTKFIESAQSGEELTLYGDGTQVRDFTYVDDIVEANILAATSRPSGQVYNLSGATHATVNDVIRVLGDIHGAPIGVNRIGSQAGDVRRTDGDSAKIKAELGWKPTVGLEEGLARQYDWCLSRSENSA
ncbi:nucleoside-diphosphate-sugar epimerase [Williamsia muralis]|uniref:Nucleoside-diphosphate-sugar epimerase n=1 Tax=Williamsia marianensis TaxID=85044 RepID=A0A495K135_WILMA|nr:GDP-mannose 4,6-dehydratase [Williamsia muralis]RKR94202.1 nucleoside-diphosphate-sugar epimerase [Williamsia muralis]